MGNISSVRRAIRVCLSVALCILLVTLGSGSALAKTIKIGVIGPMKYKLGAHLFLGAQLATDEINKMGGISVGGDKFTLDLPDAVSAMERLVTVKKADFVIGGFRSEAVLAQQEIMADNKIIYIGCAAASPALSNRVKTDYDRYKYWFTIRPDSILLARTYLAVSVPAVVALQEQLGIKKPKVAILMAKAKWTEPIAEMAHRVFPQLGCEVVGEWRPSSTATDVTAELSAIKSTGAHLIYHVHAGPLGVAVSKQWGELKIPCALVGSNIKCEEVRHWETTNGMCNYEGFIDYSQAIAMTPKTIPFYSNFEGTYKEKPIFTAIAGYEAVYLLKDAIEQTKSLKTKDLIPALEKGNYVGVAGNIAFQQMDSETPHANIWGPHYQTELGLQWVNGKQVVYWPDGRELPAALGAPLGWEGVQYEGTVDYQLPPHVIDYWKNKK